MRRTVKNEKMGERQYKLSLSVHELLGNHDTDLTKIAHPPNGLTVISFTTVMQSIMGRALRLFRYQKLLVSAA